MDGVTFPNILRIGTDHPYYQQERELRNRILLRPIGIPDFGWEHHDNKSWHFVAVKGDSVIGCVVLVPTDKNEAQLIQMAVEEEFQGSGLGSELVHHLLHFARQKGIERIEIHAREDVTGFYEKLGFETYGQVFEEVGVRHRHMQMLLQNSQDRV